MFTIIISQSKSKVNTNIKIAIDGSRMASIHNWFSRCPYFCSPALIRFGAKIRFLNFRKFDNSMLCEAKLPSFFAFLSCLFSGNDNFREERRTKREKRKEQKETTIFCRKLSFLFGGEGEIFCELRRLPCGSTALSLPPFRKPVAVNIPQKSLIFGDSIKRVPDTFFLALQIPSEQIKRTINDGSFYLKTNPNFNTNAPPFEVRGCKVILGGAFSCQGGGK